MTAALHILSPGLMTTVQDLGRPGYQQLGIPDGGALDPVALRAANALAGNAPNAAALEVLYAGPAFAVEAISARVSFVGAQATIEITSHANAARPVEMMRSILLRRGDVVRVGGLARGAVLYIAVEGGFAVEPVLGSIVSDAIAPGSIQIAGNGQPMVLLPDRQTTGGYPKIATVISADLPALGRLAVGTRIAFEGVTVAAAEGLRRKLFAEIEGIAGRIVPAEPFCERVPDLLRCNLISGVVDASSSLI
jgi:allophanate hydrolase subunit 2